MFDIFGEFDSYEEINKAAEGLKTEGDIESLKKLAKENGIADHDVTFYLDSHSMGLCTAVTAALGKISLETEELKPQYIENDWVEYIQQQVLENEAFALAVRKKGKSIFGAEAAILKYAHDNMFKPSDRILEAAGMKGKNVKLGMPGWAREKKIIKEYYLGGTK